MWMWLLAVGMVLCALLAIRAARLLTAALWLAGVSVLTSLAFYLLGAREVAVIELSVGAGLVTVLFVFAISIASDDAFKARPVVPVLLSVMLIPLLLLIVAMLLLPVADSRQAATEAGFTIVFWEDRALDVLVQIALIFAGVLGVLGLLTERDVRSPLPAAFKAVIVSEPEPASTESAHETEPEREPA